MKTFDEAWDIFFLRYGTHSNIIFGWNYGEAKNIFKRFYKIVEGKENE